MSFSFSQMLERRGDSYVVTNIKLKVITYIDIYIIFIVAKDDQIYNYLFDYLHTLYYIMNTFTYSTLHRKC